MLEELGAPIPGTLTAPASSAEATVATIPDSELDAIILKPELSLHPQRLLVDARQSPVVAELACKLEEAVTELIGAQWRPFVFPAGKHRGEGYRFFGDPTETLLTLAQACPYLSPALQEQVRQHVSKLSEPGGPLAGPTGSATLDPRKGEVRSPYDVPDEKLWGINNDIIRTPLARLYPIWLWAYVTGDFGHPRRHWQAIRELVDQQPNPWNEDCRNGYVAGLIADCRLAKHVQDEEAFARGLAPTRRAIRERLIFELAHPARGVLTEVPTGRHIFSRRRYLTPEVALLCARYAPDSQRKLMERYVDYHRSTWWLAWNVELAWRNESPYALPTMSQEIFAAKAMIIREPAQKLRKWLDIPWCKADLLYIQKLGWCIKRYLQSD
ncbi:MAG: hypothetical protein NZ899_14650 [Thermoguttaceae bacterium]|nr:hypothetical protein [Thermoguttaceae bacterium]MDW8079059.1 hypothetical protein [Thermoguttaceae bacterium]